MCNNVPLSETWCTDDSTVCDRFGCTVHHTSETSTRCVPVPSSGPTTTTTTLPSSQCVSRDRGIVAALNWLLFATGSEYTCVDALE
jgi:hypothetical protein